MRIFLTPFVILSFVYSTVAQDFSGKAIYKTSKKSNFKIKEGKGMDDKMQEEIQKRLQKMNQKTYILKFDKYTSTYKQETTLNAPKPQIGNVGVKVFSLGGSGDSDTYFKNTKEKRFANQTEIQGKRFLVKDKLPKYEWEMFSETKNIGKYTCYKATFSKEVESVKMTIKNGESVKEKTKEIVVTTAWYTPQVPVNNGPDNYQGLPGLILEINDGKKLIVCTEIILNPSEKIDITEPKKGEVVSKKKFDKIQKQKRDEMMEKMKGRNGLDLGNGVNIKFSGN